MGKSSLNCISPFENKLIFTSNSGKGTLCWELSSFEFDREEALEGSIPSFESAWVGEFSIDLTHDLDYLIGQGKFVS